MSYMKEFTKGLIKENPTLVTLLGMCPTLALTTMASNAIGMGAAATFVLICSNVVISLLKKVIPKQVRLPAYIVIIAGFVTLVGLLLQAYVPAVYSALGLYLPLITTNCAVLGVTLLNIDEGYTFLESIVNALGAGLGFMMAMLIFSGVRARLERCNVPETFKGMPITLVAASIVSLSFLGFGGLVDGIFGGV